MLKQLKFIPNTTFNHSIRAPPISKLATQYELHVLANEKENVVILEWHLIEQQQVRLHSTMGLSAPGIKTPCNV